MAMCINCKLEKLESDYYSHPQMKNGRLNKCKTCCTQQEKERQMELRNNTAWVDSERSRGRDRYHRLNYLATKKVNASSKKRAIDRSIDKYPEKYIARSMANKLERKSGCHLHHWSYNFEHGKDVIELSIKEHLRLHVYLQYDQAEKMYRRKDTGELLNTRDKHENFINEIKHLLNYSEIKTVS